ncbi:MAG: N-acetylglucosamine-6-phosphate deacetylase [Vicinamibacterales bacterium]
MIVLDRVRVALRDRLLPSAAVAIEGDRIVDVREEGAAAPAHATVIPLDGHLVVPGFVDVHVHGSAGIDVLDGPGAVAALAAVLPRFGVTSFCPTTVACEPAALSAVLSEVAALREDPGAGRARVLPAHLESNFLEPDYRGAQPATCLRRPPAPGAPEGRADARGSGFTGADVLAAIEAHAASVGIVTVAPELPDGLALVRRLTARGIRVSIGHTAATYAQALDAIAAGVCHATHLFNRMPPLGHREPGAAGAVLASHAVAAEIICDGVHVHPSMIGLAVARLGVARVMGITDATAGAGLPAGTRAHLGGQPIVVTGRGARLEDGTLAGSVLTMEAAFRTLVTEVGLAEIDAARLLATTPAEQLGLVDRGEVRAGAFADLAVLGPDLSVTQTYIAGRPVPDRR